MIIPCHTISVLVENKFGVLARIAGLFSGRGYNIHSLNVAPSHDPNLSRMTIIVREQEDTLDQIIKHLKKLINTVEVVDFRASDNVDRELILLRVGATPQTRPQIIEVCQLFRAEVIDITNEYLTIQATGDEVSLQRFLDMIGEYDIQMLTRTGRITLPRSDV